MEPGRISSGAGSDVTFQLLKFLAGFQQQLFGLLLQKLGPPLGLGHAHRLGADQLLRAGVFVSYFGLELLGTHKPPSPVCEPIRTDLLGRWTHLLDLLGDLSNAFGVSAGLFRAARDVPSFVPQLHHVLLQLLQPLRGVV